jgi:protein disulfide-isomerase
MAHAGSARQISSRKIVAATFRAELTMRRRLLLLISAITPFVAAAPLPYDESADAQAAVNQALGAAKVDQVPVLLIFGANWCEDCRALDLALKYGRNAELIGREFKVVKVDVGNFTRNLDLDRAYGDPIKKGIPAAVVLSAEAQVLYATRAGELADARRMSESGIYDFFKRVAQASRSK